MEDENIIKIKVKNEIKDIINKFGEATSEGRIYWNDKTEIYDEKLQRIIMINEHPLEIIADEIFKLIKKK